MEAMGDDLVDEPLADMKQEKALDQEEEERTSKETLRSQSQDG